MMALGLALVLAIGAGPTGNPAQNRRAALEHYRAGEALMQSEDFEEAAREFQRAVDLDPFLVVAHYNLGFSYMALKRYPEAVRAYVGCTNAIDRINTVGSKEREALERQRVDELHELQDSMTAVRTGKIKNMAVGPATLRMEERIRVLEALRFNNRGQTRIPGEVYLGLGSAYFRQNLLIDAEAAYLKAVRENERLGAAHNNLAVIFMLTGRYPQARAAIRSAEKAGFTVDARLKADLQAREAHTQRN